MNLNLLTVSALARELDDRLAGTVISSVDAVDPAGLCLRWQKESAAPCLCITAHPDFFVPFLCTRPSYPAQEKSWVRNLRMLLDRHTIVSVEQWHHDRVLRIELHRTDEIKGIGRRALICELVPRRQNLILVDLETGNVLEAFRRVTRRMSRYRLIRPGQPYQPPPELAGPHPQSGTAEEFLKTMEGHPPGTLAEKMAGSVPSVSPDLVKELCGRLNMDTEAPATDFSKAQLIDFWKTLVVFHREVNAHPPHPTLILNRSGQVQTLLAYEPQWVPAAQKRIFDNFSQALEWVFQDLHSRWALDSERKAIGTALSRALHRSRRALRRLQADLDTAQKAEEFRKMGEIISVHIGRLKKGLSQVELTDPYSSSHQSILIPLDPSLSAAENARRYFHRARKARAGEPKIKSRLQEVRDRFESLENIRRALETASSEKMEQIKAQLGQLGLEVSTSPPDGTAQPPKSAHRPLTIALSHGWVILVGRNNRENDLVTHRLAHPEDLWFHAQGVPGSHVILRREARKAEPSKEILEQAAAVAAYFSRARHSKMVPVVYTQKRYVRKPKGAKPGLVVVEREKTLFVAPNLVSGGEKLVK